MKMTKNSVCHAAYCRNHTSYDCHLWYTCVCTYLQVFFLVFQNFDFAGCQRGESAKNSPNDKKFCLSHLIF